MAYHSARYYLGWLGRWGSVDKAGIEGGICLFAFVLGNPIKFIDVTGFRPKLTTWLLTGEREACSWKINYATEDMRRTDTNFNTAAFTGAMVGIIGVGENTVLLGYDLLRSALLNDNANNMFVDTVRAVEKEGFSIIPKGIAQQVQKVLEGDAVAFGELAFGAYLAASSIANIKIVSTNINFPMSPALGSELAMETATIAVPVVTGGSEALLWTGGALMMVSSQDKPPEADVYEVKPAGRESKGFSQLKRYTTTNVIGPGAQGGGLAGVATYDRLSGAVKLIIRRITGQGKFGEIVYKGDLRPLSSNELSQLWKSSKGDLANFGRLVEERIRLRIGEATGQGMYNPGKSGAAHGPDALPTQLSLPIN